MKKETKRFFRYRRILNIITIKDNINLRQLGRETDDVTSNIFKTIEFFKIEGLINTKKEGRCKRIHLTPKGRDVKNKFIELISLLEK